MRFSYSIENLRRLTSTPSIEIRPITILLGRNSVGKSTFLRSFPLLRQSIETKSSAPILWYGDYVDFGNFKSAVANGDTERKIKFSFELKDYSGSFRRRSGFVRPFGVSQRRYEFDVDHLRISYGVGTKAGKTERDSISIELPSTGAFLELGFDLTGPLVTSLKFNGEEFDDLLKTYRIYLESDSLFSDPFFLLESKKDPNKWTGTSPIQMFTELVAQGLSGIVKNRVKEEKIHAEARKILRHTNLNHDSLTQLSKSGLVTFRKIYLEMLEGKNPKLLRYLDILCQLRYLLELLVVTSENLKGLFGSVEYIGPARARSERFYRQQELEVSEISPDGKNLPMFLASLSPSERQDFSEWVERAFGYGVGVRKTEGHISIYLQHRGQSVNIVDTGYGVSQVLPVLAQIWWVQFGKKSKNYSIVYGDFDIETLNIEQPELHLHPAHQALLADVFVEAQKSAKLTGRATSQYYIIETHSESLVNRLGELIESGDIDASDIQVVIFGDVSDDLTRSDITIAEFDKDGVLQNWPHGFFNFV